MTANPVNATRTTDSPDEPLYSNISYRNARTTIAATPPRIRRHGSGQGTNFESIALRKRDQFTLMTNSTPPWHSHQLGRREYGNRPTSSWQLSRLIVATVTKRIG